jgi:mono/diheme cytochrome c family protein
MKTSIIISFLIVLGVISMSSFQSQQKFDLKASVARGQEVYAAQCITCHQENGEGLEEVFPPLAKSDYLLADKKRSITQVIHGVSGELKVNGKIYNGEMAALDLTDQEVSDVLNYVRNSWTNKGAAVTPEEVKAARK